MRYKWFWNLFFGFLEIFGFEIILNHKQLLQVENNLLEKLKEFLHKKKIKKIAMVCLEKSGWPTHNYLVNGLSDEFKIVFVDSIQISGYGDKTESKVFYFCKKLLDKNIETLFTNKKKDIFVIINDDMIDSGGSSNEVDKYLSNFNLIFCFMLDKDAGRRNFTPKNYLCGVKKKTQKFLYGNGSDMVGSLRDIDFIFGFYEWAHDWIFKHWPIRPMFVWFIKAYDQQLRNSKKNESEMLNSVPII